MTMQVGLGILFPDFGPPPGRIAAVMEDLGYDSLWIGDHTHTPTSLDLSNKQSREINENYWRNLDMFVALTAAATVTRKLRLGTGLCLLAQRDPITVAKEAATLDHLSGGRLDFGVGAGWNAEEMANHGTSFSARWRLLHERTEVVRTIWTEDEPEFHGEFESFDPIRSYPKPVQRPNPPIVVGGNGSKAIELAARLPAEWMPMFTSGKWSEIKKQHDGLLESAVEQGRDPESVRLIPFLLDEPPHGLLEEMTEAGVEQIVLSIWVRRGEEEVFLRTIDSLAARLID